MVTVTEKAEAAVSLGVQAGDPQADAAVAGHHDALRELFSEHCAHRYGEDIDAFAPVLRVDGEVWHWDRDGIGNVRVGKKSRRATFDIYLSRASWMGKDAVAVRRSIANGLREGFDAVVDRARKEKIDVDSDRLTADVRTVIKKFLGE